jgi:hypothetical protein
MQTTKQLKFDHSVYVVLLDDAVAKHPSILRVNPMRDPLKSCVYRNDWITSRSPIRKSQERLQISLVVRKYGV